MWDSIIPLLKGRKMSGFTFKKLKSVWSNFFEEETGAIAILAGLLFVIVLGFSALVIDASFWYSERRQLQLAADAGAVGGAIAYKTTGKTSVTTYATNDIQSNNCTSGNNCTIVAINNPPTSGPNTGNSSAVEVILSKPGDVFLSQLFLPNAPILHARAVAGNKPSNYCIISLASSGMGVNVKGGANVTSPNCGVYSNSPADNSVNLVGNSLLSTSVVSTVGNINTSGGGTLATTQGTITGASAVPDPYASVVMPTFSGCAKNNYKLNNSSDTINPGVFCGGINLISGANLTMNPGVYFMDGGDFSVSSQATINATGVTIIMTSSTGSGYGSVTISGGSTVNMSAMTTGPTAGILFFGDRKSSGLSEKFTGGSGQVLSGALYFPTNDINYNGNVGVSGNPCFQLVGYTTTFTGSSTLGNGCSLSSSNGGITQLLE